MSGCMKKLVPSYKFQRICPHCGNDGTIKKNGAVEMLKTLFFKRLQALKNSILGRMTQR